MTLHPAFAPYAQCAATMPLGDALRARLAVIGRDGEAAMLAASSGVNTHRGAIWSLGLLIAAWRIARLRSGEMRIGICNARGRIPRLPIAASAQSSHGAATARASRARGARGEAHDGFPRVYKVGLPALCAARVRFGDERLARLHALLSLIARVDDTCLPVSRRARGPGVRPTRRAGGARARDCDGARANVHYSNSIAD